MEENKGDLALECLCRCCLTNNSQLKPIFNFVGNISEAIFVFTAVQFKENDGLPENICSNCLDLLNKCILLKRKVETSDMVLRKYLSDLPQKIAVKNYNTLLRKEIATDQLECGPETTSSMDSLKCEICARSYRNKTAYNRHIKSHAPKGNKIRCNDCGKRFSDEEIFQVHQTCHKQKATTGLAVTGNLFKCHTCKEVFKIEQDLFVHSSLHEDSKPFNCKACGKDFENKLKLKRHIPSHFIDKPFKCNECASEFPEMASLTRHYRKHTQAEPKPKHACSVCEKLFPNRYSLKVHIRNHTGERPWLCNKCDKRFTDRRLLNSHKILHTESKNFKCAQCNNSFRHLSTLVNHMRTHTGNRPHRCDMCKKSFKQSWSLHIHRRTHISKKRFVCNKCSQVFSTAPSLSDHVHWHSIQHSKHDYEESTETHSESFECKECLAQFSSCLDLIAHEKLTHALCHECDTCFGKWKTLKELVTHNCDEKTEISDEPAPEEMILLPNGEIRDCLTIVNTLLDTVSNPLATRNDSKENVN